MVTFLQDPLFWAQVALLAALIGLSAIFSGSEVALIGLGRLRKRAMVERGVPGADAVKRLMDHPDRLLITILIGNNLVNVAAAAIATALAINILGTGSVGLATAIATGIMTFLILMFGEITPKAYASQNLEAFALRVARPLEVLQKTIWPVVVALSRVTRRINRAFGSAEAGPIRMFTSEEDVAHAVKLASEEGMIEEDEHEMITGVLRLEDIPVRRVMVPWTDVVRLASDQTIASALETIEGSGYSRIPLVDPQRRDVVGILYVKDLLPYLETGQMSVTVREVARPAHFVPDTKRCDDLLEEMQRERIHMAVVVDEHGKTAGVVTMEDLLEEIVGEIHDEYDLGDEPIRRIDERTALVDARTPLEEVNEALDLELPFDDAYETLAGFITARLGRFARTGDAVTHDGVRIVVERAHSRRILTAKVVRP